VWRGHSCPRVRRCGAGAPARAAANRPQRRPPAQEPGRACPSFPNRERSGAWPTQAGFWLEWGDVFACGKIGGKIGDGRGKSGTDGTFPCSRFSHSASLYSAHDRGGGWPTLDFSLPYHDIRLPQLSFFPKAGHHRRRRDRFFFSPATASRRAKSHAGKVHGSQLCKGSKAGAASVKMVSAKLGQPGAPSFRAFCERVGSHSPAFNQPQQLPRLLYRQPQPHRLGHRH
jgi:hypothetical protein